MQSPPPLKANKQSLAEYTAYLERKLKMAKKASKRNPDPVESDEVEDPEPEDQDQDEGIDGGEITAEEEKEKKEAKKMAKKNCQFDNFSLPSVVENDLVSNSTTFIPKYKALGGARYPILILSISEKWYLGIFIKLWLFVSITEKWI